MIRILGVLAALFAVVAGSKATAATKQFGPFSIDTPDPDYIHLNGPIAANSALDFRRALAAAPRAKAVVLDSPGGSVSMALLIADDIHQRKLSTLVPEGASCFSACAYLFLAGSERAVQGKLGVHQISSDEPDLVSAQLAISDIIDVLNRFETPVEVLTVMFRTPADSIHIFTPQEIADYGIERSSRSENSSETALLNPPRIEDKPSNSGGGQSETDSDRDPIVAPGSLSAVESYARRPNRMAIYAGLDFFGGDLAAERAGDLVSCASRCLQVGDACQAFTFNADEKVQRPNCFLKSDFNAVDGNAVAISGVLLRRTDPDPKPFTLGAIDPRLGVMKDTDLPGQDLGTTPLPSAVTLQACRLACVGNDACMAFTFVKAKKQCWLKSGAYGQRPAEGMVSGRKEMMSFAPLKIIPLDR